MFDLEESIGQWLKLFRKHRAFDHGSIREMELHLRDHIDDLISEGHSPQRSFEMAIEEFGEIPEMAEEEYWNQQKQITFMSIINITMFSNYIKVAIRSFTKQPFFTFLNTFGLAIGMSGVLLISLFIQDEFSFDQMFTDADRIYRINIDNRTNGEYSQYAVAPGPMAGVIDEDCPQIELVTRFRTVGSTLIRTPEAKLNIKEAHVIGVDSSFFEMFGLGLLKGNVKTALVAPNSLVLTASAVADHFGQEEALGKSLLLDNKNVYVVTGLFQSRTK